MIPLYLVGLVLFLLAVRSRLPWTTAGGALLLLGTSALVLPRWEAIAPLLADPERLPAAVFLALTAAVVWWSVHRERGQGRPLEPRSSEPDAARWGPVAVGVATVFAAAAWIGAPPPPAPGTADGPWFLGGLDLLAVPLAPWFALGLLPATAFAGLLLAPHLETRIEDGEAPYRGRRDEVPFFLFAWLFVGAGPIGLSLFSASPAAPATPLSERFWIDLLGRRPPAFWLWREFPGLLSIAAYFGLLLGWLPRWGVTQGVFGRHRRRLGPWRYAAVMAIAGVLALVPLGLAATWWLGAGPWIHLPEWGIGR